jgi:NADPH2:quinone reductase
MKAAVYDHPGSPDVLNYKNVPDPILREGEVLIRVEAISIEGGDLGYRRSSIPPHSDYIGGYAAAGEIVEVGAGVTNFKIGQKVTTLTSGGSHAALRAVPATLCWLLPDEIDMQIASAVPVGLGTAVQALAQANLKKGETILILGAAGGVGVAVLQLASQMGARVLGTGSNPKILEELRSNGLTDAILLNGPSIEQQTMAILNGHGVDVLIDAVGVSNLQEVLPAVKDGGRVVLLGAMETSKASLSPMYILGHRLSILGCFLLPALADPAVYDGVSRAIRLAANGTVKIPIDKVFPLSEAVAAHKRAEERGRIGRVVMVP